MMYLLVIAIAVGVIIGSACESAHNQRKLFIDNLIDRIRKSESELDIKQGDKQ